MKRFSFSAFFFFFFLLLSDQVSKWLFFSRQMGASLSFLEPLFNTGISRGFPLPSRVSIGIAILSLGVFGFLFQKQRLSVWEFVLLGAGTLGNLLDRCFLGGVRDFIALGNFPVFNFADAFLTIAVILVCIREIFLLTPKEKKID